MHKIKWTFLDMCELTKLKQEDINLLSRTITSNGVKDVIEPLNKEKSSRGQIHGRIQSDL
jgi:hypothetical protein